MELCYSGAFFFMGVNRARVQLSRSFCTRIPLAQCWMWPGRLLFGAASSTFSIMLLVMAVDRFIFIRQPLEHLKRGRRYVLCITLPAFAVGATVTAGSGLSVLSRSASASDAPTITEHQCIQAATLFAPTDALMQFSILVGTLASMLLYVVVVALNGRRQRMMVGDTSSTGTTPTVRAQLRSQRRFTRSVSLSMLGTLWLVVVPFAIDIAMFSAGLYATCAPCMMLRRALAVPVALNSTVDALVFLSRSRELRVGARALLTGKAMPPNVRMW